jgi:alpha,alpha-trehalose phosphorylase
MERAKTLHLEGAAFPWRTIRGHECSAYWPAGTGAFHINADIADAVIRYVQATGDEAFEAAQGLELLVHTARLWRSLGHHDHSGAFHIDGVTGPDEYSAVVDDNVYTNLMAEQNLRMAAEIASRHPDEARVLAVDEEEIAAWRDAAANMHIPYDRRLHVHPQDADFTHHELMDFDGLEYPLLLHYPYFLLYSKQVIKQPDLVLALLLRGDHFTASEKARDFAYYEPLTVRDSSLSACVLAAVAAEVGHLELAYDYFGEAALMDLGDLEHNTRDGLHMASLAGSWIAAVGGFGGMRCFGGELSFRPRLPAALSKLSFRVMYRHACLKVTITHSQAVYELMHEGDPLTVRDNEDVVTVRFGEPVTREWSVPDPGPEPRQPPGREPTRRRPR